MRQPFCQLQEEVMRRIANIPEGKLGTVSGGLEGCLPEYGRRKDP